MKLLLDENIPVQLKSDLNEYEVYTVREMKWNGKLNGELLKLMIQEKFEVFITADKNMQYQQNFNNYNIPVLVLNVFRITYPNIKPLLPKIIEALKQKLPDGPTVLN